MKNFLIILVVIVVFILGYNLISKNKEKNAIQPTIQTENQPTTKPTASGKSKQESSVKEQQEEVVVVYDENGFAPKTINVPAGTTITFTNEDNSPMWVASNPHPVHSNLPGFDQKQSVEKGENYSFTFTKKGRWDYHNHRSPSDIGIIVIE